MTGRLDTGKNSVSVHASPAAARVGGGKAAKAVKGVRAHDPKLGMRADDVKVHNVWGEVRVLMS